MNEVQNFANFHTCYLPYGLKFFHKGHPKHKLNYSWPHKGKMPDCNSNAPSQPSAPPTPTIQPMYPFQCICADYFKNEGSNYLVIVDRYSNWPIIERAKDGAKGLIDSLRRTFGTFGIPDELSSDRGLEFIASETSSKVGEYITGNPLLRFHILIVGQKLV